MDTFVVFTNVNEGGEHHNDNVIIQASGKSFGMFDMTSVHGDDAFLLYKKLKEMLRGQSA